MDRDGGPLTVASSDAHARTRARSGFEHGGVGAGPYDRAATLVSRWMFTAMTESIAGR
jgi:hypothetical protein